MRFHTLLDHTEVINDVRALGLASMSEILLYRTPEELYHHLRRRDGRAHEHDSALRDRCRRVYYLASKIECAARDLVSLGDPVARALRHHDAPDSRLAASGSPVLYVKPSSIQSALSPAAYLKYIHDLAHTHILSNPGFGLDDRRPDLVELTLSDDNLGQEISTLSLVNEILAALLRKKGLFTDGASMRDRLAGAVHPFAMPFELDHATAREALAAMGLSFNTIALRGWAAAFPLLNPQFNLVAEHEECLRLYGAHTLLLRMRPSDQILYQDWYGGTSQSALRYADTFCAATGLTFEELRALVGDDYDVVDAFGVTSPQTFGFLNRGLQVRLRREGNGRYVLEGNSGASWADLLGGRPRDPEQVHSATASHRAPLPRPRPAAHRRAAHPAPRHV
ncbi:MAG: Tc toxin subunit A [Minicystis sp.]